LVLWVIVEVTCVFIVWFVLEIIVDLFKLRLVIYVLFAFIHISYSVIICILIKLTIADFVVICILINVFVFLVIEIFWRVKLTLIFSIIKFVF
jgi:hypothetical protein